MSYCALLFRSVILRLFLACLGYTPTVIPCCGPSRPFWLFEMFQTFSHFDWLGIFVSTLVHLVFGIVHIYICIFTYLYYYFLKLFLFSIKLAILTHPSFLYLLCFLYTFGYFHHLVWRFFHYLVVFYVSFCWIYIFLSKPVISHIDSFLSNYLRLYLYL